jgi:hypothetical protein
VLLWCCVGALECCVLVCWCWYDGVFGLVWWRDVVGVVA